MSATLLDTAQHLQPIRDGKRAEIGWLLWAISSLELSSALVLS
jgi:hypothetical protein